ncbi:MAG: YceI family protein [Pseudomonadota bacterium]
MLRATVFLLLALAGCAAPPVSTPPPAAPDYASWYRQAAANGKQVLAIDSSLSLIAVTVRRGGALARLGHDHVVASRAVSGFAAPTEGRADFSFRLDQMSVDEPELRRVAAFESDPSAAAIEGTRNNMLTVVLEAQRFPLVSLHVERGAGELLRLAVTLHGLTRHYQVLTRIETVGANLVASGQLKLLQSDFGIHPMSVMGGAISVQDELELCFRIVARP